jgi:uncharacterized protein (TIGR02996 family)
MDLLDEHEAFLRAIYDSPDDDTPRLVYADFLEEYGQEDHAHYIRLRCAGKHNEGPGGSPGVLATINLQFAALRRHYPDGWPAEWAWAPGWRRDLYNPEVAVEDLADYQRLRVTLSSSWQELFGAERMAISGGPIRSAEPFEAFFRLVAFARVTELFLFGQEVESDDPEYPQLKAFRLEPVVTPAGVHALASCSSVKRLTVLNLTNNNLDNDAALSLVNSPYLDNLKQLDLFQGNRFRGRVWQKVIARFGENVVG